MKTTILATIIAILVLMCSGPVQATDKHIPTPPKRGPEITHNIVSPQVQQGQYQSSVAGANSYNVDHSNMYVFPGPGMAAPLPANLCPQGDSVSWGIIWNFFWYSSSSTRTEMACLEKVLDVIKANQKPQMMLAPLTEAEKRQLQLLEEASKKKKTTTVVPKKNACNNEPNKRISNTCSQPSLKKMT